MTDDPRERKLRTLQEKEIWLRFAAAALGGEMAADSLEAPRHSHIAEYTHRAAIVADYMMVELAKRDDVRRTGRDRP